MKRKRRRYIILLGLFILSSAACGQKREIHQNAKYYTRHMQKIILDAKYIEQHKLEEVFFVDHSFQQMVYTQLEIELSEDIETVRKKLEQCEYLKITNEKPITSLIDLRRFPNLKRLYFTSCKEMETVDFTPIGKLEHLEFLYISQAPKNFDLSFLKNLTGLKELYLPDGSISDISLLEYLPNLVKLSLSQNSTLKNPEILGSLVNMEHLELDNCNIHDINFLSTLINLKELSLKKNYIEDISVLSNCTKLERLEIGSNQIYNLEPIKNLTHLYDLVLNFNAISDISALRNMKELNTLGLAANQISDIEPLADKSNLFMLDLFENPIKDLSPVLDVPLLNYYSAYNEEKREKQKSFIIELMAQDKNMTEDITAVKDFYYADINEDGLLDIGFVIQDSIGCRHLYLLLQNKDGSYSELNHDIGLRSRDVGGVRGDPYRYVFIGNGYVAVNASGGSSWGWTDTYIYQYIDGEMKLVKKSHLEDGYLVQGYNASVQDMKENISETFIYAIDGFKIQKIKVYSSNEEYFRAYPQIYSKDMGYVIKHSLEKTNYTSEEALDILKEELGFNADKEEIPYTEERKAEFESLKGISLPAYYFVIKENEKEIGYFYYEGFELYKEEPVHILIYVNEKEEKLQYFVSDIDGQIIAIE